MFALLFGLTLWMMGFGTAYLARTQVESKFLAVLLSLGLGLFGVVCLFLGVEGLLRPEINNWTWLELSILGLMTIATYSSYWLGSDYLKINQDHITTGFRYALVTSIILTLLLLMPLPSLTLIGGLAAVSLYLIKNRKSKTKRTQFDQIKSIQRLSLKDLQVQPDGELNFADETIENSSHQ